MNLLRSVWLVAASLLLSSTLSYAQKKDKAVDYDKSLKKIHQHLDSVDVRALHTGYFLNQGFLLEQQLDQQHQIQPDDPKSNVIFSSPVHFQAYCMGLDKSRVGRSVRENHYLL